MILGAGPRWLRRTRVARPMSDRREGQQKSAAGRCHGVGPAEADHHAVASFPRRTSFYSLGLAHADPSTMIKFPTELFNLSEITF